MKIIIDSNIFEQNRNFRLGVILLKGTDLSRRNSALESLVRGVKAQRRKDLPLRELENEPMVRVWNQAFGNFGLNPLKNLPLIAQYLKSAIDENFRSHNPLLLLAEYFSLKFLLPLQSHDLDWLCGDAVLRYTRAGEPFRQIDTIAVDFSNEGEIAYVDQGGIISRFWNSINCERSKITDKTVNAVLLLEDLSGMPLDSFGEILRELQSTVGRYIGGNLEAYVLNEDKFEVETGIFGRRQADDSRVPPQEIAHFQKTINEGTL